jgi:hypothetical protein
LVLRPVREFQVTRAIGLIIGIFGVALSAQAPDLLDLTAARVDSGKNTAATSTGSAGGFASHTVRSRMPVKLTVESMDRDAYQETDTFTFRIRLTNVGRAAVTLPWTPTAGDVTSDMESPVVRCLLAFDIHSPALGSATFPIAVLYGSRLSPGTLKIIQPGESVQIVGEGNFRFLTDSLEQRARALMPFSGDLVARVGFLTGIERVVYEDLVSDNRVPITLERGRSG